MDNCLEKKTIKKRNRKTNYDHRLFVRMPTELYKALKIIAKSKHVSMSSTVRELIDKYVGDELSV